MTASKLEREMEKPENQFARAICALAKAILETKKPRDLRHLCDALPTALGLSAAHIPSDLPVDFPRRYRLTATSIGIILGVSARTVRAIQHRAIKRLRTLPEVREFSDEI